MTDDEKRQQKAALLLEYQETEDDLRHLHERSHRITETMTELLRTIQPNLGAIIDDRHAHYDRPTKHWDHGKIDRAREALNIDGILDLANEIRKTESKLEQLKSRKQSLGLR